jgi:integrase
LPKLALTDAAVQRLKPVDGKQVDYFDSGYPGLCLRVGGRSRTWCYVHRLGGKLRRHQLGTYPDKSLAEARDLWRKAREQVQAGRPPRPAPRHRDAIETVVADWLRRDQASNATHAEVKRAFDAVILPAWSGRLITSIDRRDVLDILDPIADRGKLGRADKLHAWINRLMVWSVGRGILPANPMAHLPKYAGLVKRDRVLSDAEIAALWRAAKTIGWPYGSIVQLLVLTLAREDEIASLKRVEIDARDACIRLPSARSKNDEARVIPLGPLAWRIAAGAPIIADCPYVFPSSASTPITAWGYWKRQLDAATGINAPYRLHDLRRTGATWLEQAGVPLQVTESILGHTAGSKSGVVGIYQQHQYKAEKRAALAKWAAHLLCVTDGINERL